MILDQSASQFATANRVSRAVRTAVAGLLLCGLSAPSAQAAVDLSATTVASPARAGDYLPIEWTITNTDDFTREGLVMTMVFPAGLAQLGDGGFSGDCPSSACEVGETITWTLGSLAPGSAMTFSFAPRIAPTTVDGASINFEPLLIDSLLDESTTVFSVDVNASHLYDLALAESRDPATPGSLLTYEVSFGYLQDTAAVTNSTLRFNVPANATFVSASGGGTNAGGVVSWPLGFLQPGQSGEREVTVQLDAGLSAGQLVQASAEVFSVSAPSSNATVAASTVIAGTSGLQVEMETNPDPARPGEFLNIDVSITNTDPFTRFGVSMSALWPQELAQYGETNFDGDCPASACEPGEFVVFTLGDIPAGASVTTRIAPRISTVALTGSVMALKMTAMDLAGLQARQSDSVRVETANIYDVALAEDADPVVAGATMNYQIHYALRADAGTVSNSVLRLPIPAGVSFVSASDGGSLAGGVVSWPLGVLNPGQNGVRDVTVTVDGGLANASVIEATAEITSAAASLNSALAEASTVVGAGGGLQVAVESNVNPGRANERSNLQLVVRNADPFTRFGVTLTGLYPENFAQLGESLFEGDCSSSACEPGERVVWTLGDIGAGESAVVVLPAVMSSTASDGTLASLYLQAEDSLGLQTRQMQTMRIDSDTVYDLILAENADPVAMGADVNYTLSWGYRADAGAVAQTVLRMPVPAGLSFVSASDGGALVNGRVQWSLGFLSPGANGLRNVSFAANAGLNNGSVIEARADMTGASSNANRLRVEALTSVAPASGLKIAIEANTNAARLGEKSNYRMTVSNTDPFPHFGVQVVGRFPQEILQLSETQFNGDCPSSACEGGENVAWLIGDILAGDARTVDLPGRMTNAGVDGILANFFVVATDDLGTEARLAETLRLQSDTVYDVSLTESADPAVVGSTLSYTLTFGMREDAPSTRNSALELTLPAGVTLQSATEGFVQDGNVVTWSLGFLAPGDVGIRSAQVAIDGGLAGGSVLEAAVDLFDIAAPDERSNSEAHTVVRTNVPLALDVDSPVYSAIANLSLNTRLTVTNTGNVPRFGVQVTARFPRDVAQFAESAPNFDGQCPSSACEPDEVVVWPSVDLPVGESVTVTFPPNVAANVVEGSLINLYAWATDDVGEQARGTASFSTGCVAELDADCDGILDTQDNCLGQINTDQRDTDADGIGNRCDPDIDPSNNCVVNVVDLGILRAAFFGTPASDNWNPDADFNGNNVVNVEDLGILRGFFFQAPGPSALPNACDP